MKKILIVEDDHVLSMTLNDNLTHEGFETAQAYDGEEGLALALAEKPDLILLDILLGKMDGLTMLHKLREDPWGKSVPVIIMSNVTEPLGIASALTLGVHEYLLKADWTMDDVVKQVREKLKM